MWYTYVDTTVITPLHHDTLHFLSRATARKEEICMQPTTVPNITFGNIAAAVALIGYDIPHFVEYHFFQFIQDSAQKPQEYFAKNILDFLKNNLGRGVLCYELVHIKSVLIQQSFDTLFDYSFDEIFDIIENMDVEKFYRLIGIHEIPEDSEERSNYTFEKQYNRIYTLVEIFLVIGSN